jgi:type II secretory pathway component GspD/PulD (secretin)
VPRTQTCGGFISKAIVALLVLSCILSATPAVEADDMVLEVIPLHHRSATELLPVVRDFVAKDGVIKAADGKLIVRTHPANLKEMHDLITKLDVPLRSLVITVKQLSGESARSAEAAAGSSNRTWQTASRDEADRIQQIRVIEDKEGFVDVGRKIPISDFAISQSQSGTLMEQKTRYIGATTGFYVRPHLNGDSVSVEITPYQTSQSGIASPPEFRTQALHTTVSGKLGEWLTIGASTTRERQPGVIEYSTSQRGEQDRRILLRVTVAP